jgi:hypothetical protein
VPPVLDQDVLVWAHPACRLAVLWLLYRAVRTPEVDAGLRLWPVLVAAVGLTAALTVALQLVPGALPVVTSRADKLAAAYVGGWHPGGLLLVTAWTAAGCAFAVRAVRTRRWLFAWFGLLFVAFACVELLRFATHPVESVWVAGPSAMRLVGLLFGLTGATRELVRTFQDQQGHLLERVESEKTTQARLQAEQRALEERAHEARNALTAIEGATRTLQHYRDQLDEATRESLTEAVTREIARLQQLVSAEQVISTRGRFRLADVVAGDPEVFRRRGRTDTAAAAIVWVIAKANDLLVPEGLTAKELHAWFGVTGSASRRASTLLRAAGIEGASAYDMRLGTPRYLVASRRRRIIELRDRYEQSGG